MKVTIEADTDIKEFNLTDLDKKMITVKNNQEMSMVPGWYLLSLEYTGQKINIKDVKINDCSLKETLYISTFTTYDHMDTHYSTALWEPGVWQLWVHTNVGYYKASIMSQIRNGDYGKNLNETYSHTVDWNTRIDDKWPEDIKSFFAHGYGPRWWHKKYNDMPYKILEPIKYDKEKLYKEIERMPKGIEKSNGWQEKTFKDSPTWPPFDLGETGFHELDSIAKAVGFTKVLNVAWLTMAPRSSIHLHIDDEYIDKVTDAAQEKFYHDCTIFYMTLVDPKGFIFKIEQAGLIPTDKPLMLNASKYPHSLINDSDITRETIRIHGVW